VLHHIIFAWVAMKPLYTLNPNLSLEFCNEGLNKDTGTGLVAQGGKNKH